MTSNGDPDALENLTQQWSNKSTRPNPTLVQKVYSLYEQHTSPDSLFNTLDASLILEQLLWPSFDQSASQQHTLLLASLITYKHRARTLEWTLFQQPDGRFSLFFHRLLSLSLDTSVTTSTRTTIIAFVSCAFQALEQDVVRKECASLVSIGIWEHLHSDSAREQQLDRVPARRKAWKNAQKRLSAADPQGKLSITIERAWLYNMVLDFFARTNAETASPSLSVLCARFLELLIELVSQLPTRRYTIVLLRDLNVVPLVKQSKLYNRSDCTVIRDLTSLFEQFLSFQIDDNGDTITSRKSAHRQDLIRLQRLVLQNFPDTLKVLGLSNLGALEDPEELKQSLQHLTEADLIKLCTLLNLRISYPASAAIVPGRELLLEILLAEFTTATSIQDAVQDMLTMPTEQALYDRTLLIAEDPDNVELTLPKLGLQYLTLADFLWRAFTLHQAEAFFEIRRDLEAISRKLKPQLSASGQVTFGGFSKMAIPIEKPAIIDVLPPRVGESVSAQVKAEVILDVSRLGDKVRSEWDALKPRDTVFLLSITPFEPRQLINGSRHSSASGQRDINLIRTAEVIQLLDEKSNPLREHDTHRGRTRRLMLSLDPKAFASDRADVLKGKPDVYKTINLISRRSSRENNFRPLLESIKGLLTSTIHLPPWLQGVFLGYDRPSSASYPVLASDISSVDFLDTFLDWHHLHSSFKGRELEYDGDHAPTPPYVLQMDTARPQLISANPKKRRLDQLESASSASSLRISSYQPLNTGPYPKDKRKTNHTRFYPKQIEALVVASHPGLSLVVGPPGTGKTDVATQLMNILYHNFPDERILLIAHSNQALNQLFQKIVALDIDPRHLLRLGHGQESLESDESFGKSGRVESFLDQRQGLLGEVARLASSMMVEGAHGATCETADYFNTVYVRPAWTYFWSIANDSTASSTTIQDSFPFHKFFSDAPFPELFGTTTTVEQCRHIARGCQSHLDKIFTELEVIRPFEVLRSSRDQANHLLVKEARVIAMTATHAAIRRAEIAHLGFHYDTLVMEEAAQVTEIESLIPCAMQQEDENGAMPIKRIVLFGDHLQNSPIIQNFGLRQNANLEQSLFLRLIRLGVPHIMLDAQGRCRPSLARLFEWRYPGLQNLPHVLSEKTFTRANAGLRYDHQFINVDDYHETGEREPSPHFIQNLGEAEYTVALYQYMRLLGYPAKSISILAAYAGQRALIRDVLEHRCKGNKLFGMPHAVTTIDKYQGEQNDYIILSLTRTKTVGYLRDVRRLTVALSRARLGLYILGRRSLFEKLPGLDIACQIGNAAGNLEVVTGELFPTERGVDEAVPSTEIHGVEHMGQYVYEMTQAKVKSLGGVIAEVTKVDQEEELVGTEEEEPDLDAELDPLHEDV